MERLPPAGDVEHRPIVDRRLAVKHVQVSRCADTKSLPLLSAIIVVLLSNALVAKLARRRLGCFGVVVGSWPVRAVGAKMPGV